MRRSSWRGRAQSTSPPRPASIHRAELGSYRASYALPGRRSLLERPPAHSATPVPGRDTNENTVLAGIGRTSNGDVEPRWDTGAPRDWDRASVADLVLVDQPVEGLPIDTRGLRRRGHVAPVALEQLTQIRGLEHLHPFLLRVLQRQVAARGQGRAAGRRGRWATDPVALQQIVRQVAPRDEVAVRQRAGALDDVLQLAHVPGPRITFQGLERRVIEARYPLAPVALEERVGQKLHVARALAERRQRDRDHVDAVVELLAE